MSSFNKLFSCCRWFRRQILKFKNALYGRECIFTDKELFNYELLTFLAVEEIHRVYQLFTDVGADFTNEKKNPYVEIGKVSEMPEFSENPFRDRIFKVFCEFDGYISFDEFLNVMSVFNVKVPSSVKIQTAFKIYDFNEDNLLCAEDIEEILNRLKGENTLKKWVYEYAADAVLTEADMDSDGYINSAEFELLLSKNPEFVHSFNIRV